MINVTFHHGIMLGCGRAKQIQQRMFAGYTDQAGQICTGSVCGELYLFTGGQDTDNVSLCDLQSETLKNPYIADLPI